jgi:hypothetical protein
VTTTGDPFGLSQCSLRVAILTVAILTVDDFGVRTVCGIADESGNTIVLGPHSYTWSLGPSGGDGNDTGDLALTPNIPTTIEGAGVGQTTISGAGFPAKNPDRLFHVIAGTVTIRDLTLSDGTALPARATIVVFAQTAGIAVHVGKCMRPRAHAHGRTCIRLVRVGSAVHGDRVGRNAVRFSGRVSGHKLPPGRYVLELTPAFDGQKGKTVVLRCQVI